MAEKEGKGKDDKPPQDKPWTPDQPLEDAEDEEQAQRTARCRARTTFLQDQLVKPSKGSKRNYNAFGD